VKSYIFRDSAKTHPATLLDDSQRDPLASPGSICTNVNGLQRFRSDSTTGRSHVANQTPAATIGSFYYNILTLADGTRPVRRRQIRILSYKEREQERVAGRERREKSKEKEDEGGDRVVSKGGGERVK